MAVHADALTAAVTAVIVAGIGIVGDLILSRRRAPEGDAVTALATALAAETRARRKAEKCCDECRAREKARHGQ